jgi:hypothetical protein
MKPEHLKLAGIVTVICGGMSSIGASAAVSDVQMMAVGPVAPQQDVAQSAGDPLAAAVARVAASAPRYASDIVQATDGNAAAGSDGQAAANGSSDAFAEPRIVSYARRVVVPPVNGAAAASRDLPDDAAGQSSGAVGDAAAWSNERAAQPVATVAAAPMATPSAPAATANDSALPVTTAFVAPTTTASTTATTPDAPVSVATDAAQGSGTLPIASIADAASSNPTATQAAPSSLATPAATANDSAQPVTSASATPTTTSTTAMTPAQDSSPDLAAAAPASARTAGTSPAISYAARLPATSAVDTATPATTTASEAQRNAADAAPAVEPKLVSYAAPVVVVPVKSIPAAKTVPNLEASNAVAQAPTQAAQATPVKSEAAPPPLAQQQPAAPSLKSKAARPGALQSTAMPLPQRSQPATVAINTPSSDRSLSAAASKSATASAAAAQPPASTVTGAAPLDKPELTLKWSMDSASVSAAQPAATPASGAASAGSANYARPIAVTANAAQPPKNRDEDRAWSSPELVVVKNDRLDDMRGGFDLPSGLVVSFGISRAAFVNGNLVNSTSFNIPDIANMTPQQAQMLASANSGALIQNGPGNAVQSGGLPNLSGAVIQNTLSNQQIQALTTINTTVNSLSAFKVMNLGTTLNSALTNMVRPR